MSAFHKVLFPTDFSKNADQAFPFACALARDQKAGLVVLHVYPPPLDRSEAVARAQPPRYEEDLWQLLKGFEAPGVPGGVIHRLEEGDTVEEILRVAQTENCDLIVIGTHGRSGLSRLLMGSVAEQVLRKATCPLLTVKPAFITAELAKEGATHEAAS